jgi:hypothetical protein
VRRRFSRKGIFLISVLFVTLIISMYLAAAVALFPSDLMQTRSGGLKSAARQAAISGVSYALTRLRNNPQWRGDGAGDASAKTVNLPDMVVAEDHGNVVGMIQTGSSGFAQFRIRFNNQSSSGGPNGLGTPSPSMVLDLGALSINNLPGATDTIAPIVIGANPPATTPSSAHFVPARSVWLCVEGRAGSGLGGMSASNPNPALTSGMVSTVTVQTSYRLNPNSTPTLDGVAMAGGDIVGNLSIGTGAITLASSVTSTLPRLRTKGNLSVLGGGTNQLVSTGAEAYTVSNTTDAVTASNLTKLNETASASFYQLPANKVTQAAAGSPTMPAGTYVVWQDKSVHYYDMSLPDYQTHMANPLNAGDLGVIPPPSLPSSMTLSQDSTSKAITITVQGDTRVVATAGTNDLSIIPRSGAATGSGAATVAPDATLLGSKLSASASGGAYTDSGSNAYAASNFLQGLLSTVLGWATANPTNTQVAAVSASGITFDSANIHSSTGRSYGGGQFNDDSGSPSWSASANTLANPLIQAWANANPSLAAQNANYQSVSGQVGINTAGAGLVSNSGGDTLSPANLSLNFAPTNSAQFAVLSAPANVSIGTGLSGQGGSIVSTGGDIQITGMGVNLAANPNAKQGVSLYSQGNINIDTFHQTGTNGNQIVGNYQDLSLKGVIYACGSVNVVQGDPSTSGWGQMNLEGAIVAYGNSDPSQNPTTAGKINLTAANATLTFDPSYLQNLMNGFPSDIQLERFYWDEH